MLNFLGFSAQLIAILSIVAIVISCISSPQASSAVISTDRISCAEDTASSDDATQLVSSCALSMDSPVYVTIIDEPSASPDNLSCLTVRQLKALCRERGIKRYSSLRKSELIALLQH